MNSDRERAMVKDLEDLELWAANDKMRFALRKPKGTCLEEIPAACTPQLGEPPKRSGGGDHEATWGANGTEPQHRLTPWEVSASYRSR